MSSTTGATSTSHGTAPKDKLIFAPGAASAPASSADTSTDPAAGAEPSRAAQFTRSELHRSNLADDPVVQFHAWFSDSQLSNTVPETVVLSTSELPTGRVSSRVVYLKELDQRGFVIYSNFGTSRKARDIATNQFASLCFWWKPVERQVRVEGVVERLAPEESQIYYDTRARGSRIGAWASEQSRVLPPTGEGSSGHGDPASLPDDGRAVLDGRVKDVEQRFDGQERIPVPPFWGGLRIIPDTIEFWQGRESRLHDRFVYTRIPPNAGEGTTSGWKIERLSP